jgi:hypothetical protein
VGMRHWVWAASGNAALGWAVSGNAALGLGCKWECGTGSGLQVGMRHWPARSCTDKAALRCCAAQRRGRSRPRPRSATAAMGLESASNAAGGLSAAAARLLDVAGKLLDDGLQGTGGVGWMFTRTQSHARTRARARAQMLSARSRWMALPRRRCGGRGRGHAWDPN